jgi:hypothetical protein
MYGVPWSQQSSLSVCPSPTLLIGNSLYAVGKRVFVCLSVTQCKELKGCGFFMKFCTAVLYKTKRGFVEDDDLEGKIRFRA